LLIRELAFAVTPRTMLAGQCLFDLPMTSDNFLIWSVQTQHTCECV